MSKYRKKSGHGRAVAFFLFALAYLFVLIAVLLKGNNIALFHTKGLVASEELELGLLTVGIMLIIAIPVMFIFYFTAWKYRETNPKAKRDANVGHGKLLNLSMWGVPFIFMIVLSAIMWPATHRLEPQKQIAADAKPLTIQVVAQRWKWLFIYPEQKIATVNYVQVPVNTPVTFELTADETPMSGFWIPNWGGMLYAMTGHVNKLNLLAETPGEYPGSTAEINGAGFAGMKFTASATTKAEFDNWVMRTRLSSGALDASEYAKLLKPSENNAEAFYSLTDGNLYAKVLLKYAGGHQGHHTAPAQDRTQHEGMHH